LAFAAGLAAQEPAKPLPVVAPTRLPAKALAEPAAQDPEPTPEPNTEPPPRERPRPADAAALFALFRTLRGLEARFEEKKYLALLAVPLESRGRMFFLRPGYLARRVEAPEVQAVTITPTELRVAGRDGEEVIDLRQSANVRHFVTSLVRVFSGDQESLAKGYRIEYAPIPAEANPDDANPNANSEGDPSRRWSLTLTPKAKPLSEMLRSLQLRGEGQAVTHIEVVEPNGDRTVTRILEANPAREFSAEEKALWFGIQPR